MHVTDARSEGRVLSWLSNSSISAIAAFPGGANPNVADRARREHWMRRPRKNCTGFYASPDPSRYYLPSTQTTLLQSSGGRRLCAASPGRAGRSVNGRCSLRAFTEGHSQCCGAPRPGSIAAAAASTRRLSGADHAAVRRRRLRRAGAHVARGEQLALGQAAIGVLVRIGERRIGTFDEFLPIDLSVAIDVVIFEPGDEEGSVHRADIAEFVLGQKPAARFVRAREGARRSRPPLIAGDGAVAVLIVAADPANEALVDAGNLRTGGAGAARRQAAAGETDD